MPNEPEYGDGFVAANRRAENGVDVDVDRDGCVAGGRLVDRDEPTEEFWKAMRRTRDLYVIEPADIVLGGWPVDADGRGLSVQEAKALHLTRIEG